MEFSVEDYLRFRNTLPQTFAHEITYAVKHKAEDCDVRLSANIFDKNGVNQWMEEFKAISKTSWCIRSTPSVSGTRVLYKRRYGCIHFSRNHRRVHSESTPTVRNTNCPAIISFTVSTIRKKSRCKINIPNPLMPCEIYLRLSHNHPTNSINLLRFKPVSNEVKEKLRNLFRSGHTAATAWDSIKKEIRETNPENFEVLLSDRSKCPDYHFCYRLYTKEFNNDFGCDVSTSKEDSLASYDSLVNKLTEYNKKCGGRSCASWECAPEQVIIAICTPLMKRAHKLTPQAAEVVFLDSTGAADTNGHRISILHTHNEGGGVPLGIIFTSSETPEPLTKGWTMLKALVGADAFFSAAEGPTVFMTNDFDSERKSLSTVWPDSALVLCLFHVLQAVWKWLQESTHGVLKADRPALYRYFKQIAYARTEEQCCERYEAMRKDPIVSKYTIFVEFIESRYWARRWKWALSCFHSALLRGKQTGNFVEASMQVLKDKVFEGCNATKLPDLVEFVINRLDMCFERKLLDASQNRPPLKDGLEMKWIEPPSTLLLQIQELECNTFRVPSESSLSSYVIDAELQQCECKEGNDGALCKHQVWLSMKLGRPPGGSRTFKVRNRMHLIATGKEIPDEMLESIDIDWDDRCKQAVSKIAERLTERLVLSKENVCLAVEKMADTIPKIQTESDLVLALTNFGNAGAEILEGLHSPAQTTSILLVQPPMVEHKIPLPPLQSNARGRPKRAGPVLRLAAQSLPGRRRPALHKPAKDNSQSAACSVKMEPSSELETIAV